MSATLTRSQFETACKVFIAKYGDDASTGSLNAYLIGWTWRQHASLSQLGCLSRSVLVSQRPTFTSDAENNDEITHEIDDTADDASSAPTSLPEVLTIQQHIVHSPTFQVPTFYWTMHRRDGSPLSLEEMLATDFLRTTSLPEHQISSFALSPPGSPFPLLSQGDHPVLGTPSWYLHPCHTAEAVAELMSEIHTDGWSEAERMLRWLELWFMVLGGVVDLKCGCS